MFRKAALCSLLALACESESSEPAETDGDTEGTGDVEPLQTPGFIEPASGVLRIPTTRTRDIALRVAGITPGQTSLVIDDRNYGALQTPRPVGQLDADQLTLHVRGALVEGRHLMRLQTSAPDALLQSEEIQIEVVAEDVPALELTLDAEPTFAADAIASWGLGDEAVLLVLQSDLPDPPRVQVLRAQGPRWLTDDPMEVPLPQLAASALTAPCALTAAIALGELEDPSDDRLRIAWRTADERVLLVDEPWGAQTHHPKVAFELDALITTPVELASLGRPLLVSDILIVEVFSTRDIEQPKPGDRSLATVALLGTPAVPGPARFSTVAGTVDVDRLGMALDPVAASGLGPRSISARIGGVAAAVIEVDRTAGTLFLASDPATVPWQVLTSPLATVVGALGSRIVFGAHSEAIEIQRIDELGTGDVSRRALSWEDLELSGPELDTTRSDPAISLLQGAAVMLVAGGEQAPVRAIVSTASTPGIQPLDDVFCDQVAVIATDGGDEQAGVQLACLRDQELYFGILRVAP